MSGFVARAEEMRQEYRVKAAFLYNFCRFVRWPSESDGRDHFVVGVLGDDPFGSILDETFCGKEVGGKKVLIKRFSRLEGYTDCQLLFVSSSLSNRSKLIKDRFDGHPVLTVGEALGFAEKAGIIELYLEKNNVRFKIHPKRARSGRLGMSSKLLRLAKIVPRDGS